MVTIEAEIYDGDDVYKIVTQDVSPTEAAKQVMKARRRILNIIKKEESNESNS